MSRPDAANLSDRHPGLVPLLDLLVEVVPTLQAVYLFGSEASGRASTESDLDLGVLAEAPLPNDVRWQLAAELAQRAGRDVDLVDLRQVDPILAFQILSRGERLLVRDSHAQAVWEMTALSRYQDWKLCRRENERALLRESVA
jgi:predicted nucleotidyltransferase